MGEAFWRCPPPDGCTPYGICRSGKGDVKKLKGRLDARLRIGDWRVIFDETNDTIIVVAVGHRREIYD